jgi:aminoglycoside 2''-phosphotransferase
VGGSTLTQLAARIRQAFPSLAFDRAVLNEVGEDHQVLILDDRYVFRFPRHPHHPTGLALEIGVLQALKGRCALPAPDYRYVAPSGAFAGYEMIQGRELTPDLFASLSEAAQARVLDQIAEFLSAMHGLTPREVETVMTAPPLDWPRLGSNAEWIPDGRARRLGPIAAALPDLAPRVADFYDRFAERPTGPERLIHSDVTGDHLLLSPAGDRLSGIIDFGDTELGDAAYDFAYLFSYGDGAPAYVFARYALKAEDPDLLDRAFWFFVRYRVARLGEAIERGWADRAAEIAADLPHLLARL